MDAKKSVLQLLRSGENTIGRKLSLQLHGGTPARLFEHHVRRLCG